MATGRDWTKEELILAINLYCKLPFGKIHIRTPEIIELAAKLDRSPGSVSYKLANFAGIDPKLDRKGAVKPQPKVIRNKLRYRPSARLI